MFCFWHVNNDALDLAFLNGRTVSVTVCIIYLKLSLSYSRPAPIMMMTITRGSVGISSQSPQLGFFGARRGVIAEKLRSSQSIHIKVPHLSTGLLAC
jgi:hypothetical protein